MRPTPIQDRRPGTSADVPDVPSPTSMKTKCLPVGQSVRFCCTIPNNKKDALVNVKFDNLPVVKNKK